MLDMLTDRCATMCLLVNLSLLYPSYTFLFQLSMTLDVASHWLHLHRYAVAPGAPKVLTHVGDLNNHLLSVCPQLHCQRIQQPQTHRPVW